MNTTPDAFDLAIAFVVGSVYLAMALALFLANHYRRATLRRSSRVRAFFARTPVDLDALDRPSHPRA